MQRICHNATDAVLADNNILILSDRAASPDRIPIPALLATAAVHHHLIRQGLRMQTGLVVETGEAREVHHFCVLAGYGAEAINPYLAFETLEQIRVRQGLSLKPYEVQKNYIKAVGKGMLKVMSKMGISTYQSYCGAQIFDAVGLASEFVEKYFTGTATTIEGVGLKEIAEECVRRHTRRLSATIRSIATCWMWAATTPSACAARTTPGRRKRCRGCSMRCAATIRPSTSSSPRPINEQSERLLTLRGLMEFKTGDGVPLDEVEPAVGDRQALLHRGDELRLDQPRGPHHSRHRHEPHRRPLQHRRGRRGSRPLRAAAQRRFHALGDQAGGVGPLRRHRRISGQRRRHPDQDGPGRQARRRRPAARPQGGRRTSPRCAIRRPASA